MQPRNRALLVRQHSSFKLTKDDTAGPSPFGSASSAASIRANHPFTVACKAATVVAGHTRQASDRCSVVRAAMPAPTAELCCAPPRPPPAPPRLSLLLLLLSSPSPSVKRGKSRSFSRMGGISRHTLLPLPPSPPAASSSSSRRRGRGLQPRARLLLRLLLLPLAFPELSKEGRAARGSEERGGCVLSSGRGRNPPVREPPQHCWVLS